MRRIGIVDVGIGNLGSIGGAVSTLGFDVLPVRRRDDFDRADAVILPGVGAFAHAMSLLERSELVGSLRKWARDGRPLLGICLGMQLLFKSGEEGGQTDGLNLIDGKILRIQEEPTIRLPHVGWNEISVVRNHPILSDVKQGVDFYFVHSYRASCSENAIIAKTEYGDWFPSIVGAGSVVGTQFHCEKSQRNGLRLLENFCWWDGRC
jgi:imidazole glycerol-phosphate synthase subunit HisH